MRGWILCCGLVWGVWGGLSVAAQPAVAVMAGQVDDFQDGTNQGWVGGAAPTNIADGGPDGVGDRYLQISSVAGNLGTNNFVQWIGDYAVEDIQALGFHLNNLGPTDLSLRITLFGTGGHFTTTDETFLPAGSGWVAVEFGLDELALTKTSGNGTLAQTLASVSTLLIRHDPDPISAAGQQNPVTGTLGIDNITALPEPDFAWALFAGVASLGVATRVRARSNQERGPRAR